MLCIRAVDVDVLEQNVLRVDDRHSPGAFEISLAVLGNTSRELYIPHLTLHETYTLEHAVTGAGNCDLMWTTRVVVGAINKVVPHLWLSGTGNLPPFERMSSSLT